MEQTLSETQTHELELEDDESRAYVGRLTGVPIATNERHEVYLTDDKRVIVYDRDKLRFQDIGVVGSIEADDLRWLGDEDAYLDACNALGIKPVVDL